MTSSPLLRILAVLSLGLAACTGPAPTPEDAGSRYACTVDPAALEQRTSCLADDSCPCGSHCDTGTCSYECRADGDCGESRRCDGFGRCVTSDGIAPPPAQPNGTLVLGHAPVELDLTHAQGFVTVLARGAPLDRVRVVAPAGIEVSCGGSMTFGAECELTSLAANAQRAVRVRADGRTVESSYDVKVFAAAKLETFRVKYTRDVVEPDRPLEGVYRGFAHPSGFGSVARSTTSQLPAPLEGVSIPVDVTIWPEANGRRVVALSDALGLVFPEPTTVAELLRASDGALLLRYAPRPYLASGGVDVALSAESTSFEKGKGGVAFTLRSRFAGVLDPANDLQLTWAFSLGRVSDLPAGATAPAAPAPYAPRDAVANAGQRLAAEAAVESAIPVFATTTPRTASDLTQALICTPYAQGATAVKLGASIGSPFSGDLSCEGSAAPLTFGLLKDSSWQLAGTLSRCIADLRQSAAVMGGTLSPSAGMGCADGARVVAALGHALDADRRRALGENVSADPVASALAHRLLQQWLRAHVFVARQATQVDLLNDILANEQQLDRGFQQTEMLALTGHGFDLLLQPRVAMGVSRLVPQVVFSPDYRPRLQPGLALTPNPRHEHHVGLPVTLADSLQQALGVYGELYERARYVPADRPALEASAKTFLRKSVVLFALASTLNDVTRANNPGAPAWDALWVRASGQYGAGLAGLLRAIDNLARGENPLGLDDRLDLPLYRVGDQAGSIARFSAVSDYLLGARATADDKSIVPARIIAAETALTAARTAYSQNLQQDFVQAGADAARGVRLEALRRRYGEQVASLCGDPAMNSVTVLDQAASIDPDTCFIKPACRLSAAERRARLEPGDVASVLCQASGVRELLGATASPLLAQAPSQQQLQPLLDGRLTVQGHAESGGRVTVTFSDGSTVVVPVELFEAKSSQPPAGAVEAEQLTRLQDRCSMVKGASDAARPEVVPGACGFSGECPGGYACVAAACVPAADVAGQTACYTGALGEQTVAIRAATKDVEVARSELSELTETYDLQMRKCIITSLGAEAALDATRRHDGTMKKLGAVKLAADVAANAAGMVADCADAVGSDTKFGAASATTCAARATEAVAKSVSDGMQLAMDVAEREHAFNLMRIEAVTERRACFTEAEMALVGTRTATLRIQRANQEVARQLVALFNARVNLVVALQEGGEAVAAELGRTVPALGLEFWLDEKVERYRSSFRAARRAAYLGVLAVEYEYQLSTIERQNVLAATRVSELRAVMERLRDLAATGTVKGRLPSELHSVVSLRGNLLQLSGQQALPAGWHTLSEVQRFQLLLTSPRFAVHGADGQYLGQELPFRVAPLSGFKLGDAGGIALLAGGDCAERIWSVNAAVQGDGAVVGDATRVRVTLKKRNRFFSQWCSPAPAGSSPYQVAATRPSRNLFLDPFADYVPGAPGNTPNPAATVDASAEADAFTVARLQPELNVSRAQFEMDPYFNGSSRELAGRGLYGDYALFFPAEVLARNGSEGLRLEKLTDVLLRFDYVSVAQN